MDEQDVCDCCVKVVLLLEDIRLVLFIYGSMLVALIAWLALRK